MSSFWQNSTTKIREKPSKTINDSLPTLNHRLKTIKTKGSSQSIHHLIQSNETKILRTKDNTIIRNPLEKKQTLINLCSRSTYKVSSKNQMTESPVVQFGQALQKIQEVFNQQFGISKGDTSKGKRTFNEKIGFKKLNEFQNIIKEGNPIRCAKRQFEQIFRLFARNPLKNLQNIPKQQKEDSFMRTRKQNTILWSFKKTRQHSEQRRYDQSLTQMQKEQFMKQTQVFQKAQKHLLLKSYTVKILYHHLNSELAIESAMFQQALESLYYCEYYARKIDFDHYIVPCLIMQSEVKQSLYRFDEAIKILKTALEFAIVKKWKQLEMRILQKVSIVYYYRGNSYMAKYYKELSQIGMPLTERDIFIKQYSKSQELLSLESRLFSLPYEGISKKKHNQKYEFDISRDLFLDHQNMIISQHEQVSSMLRSNKTSKIGIKLRRLIIENCQRAQVTKHSPNHFRNDTQVLPRFIAFDYPMQNCNQILKSHLSKGRAGLGQKNKGVNFLKTFNFMKTLYRRLNYELISGKREQFTVDKENIMMMTNI